MKSILQCQFTELFSFSERAEGYPFNCRFGLNRKRPKFDGSGPGLYFISIGEEVVYIGSYQSEKDSIIADRFAKHVQTISFRGRRVGFGAGIKSKDDLMKKTDCNFLNQFDSHDFDGRFRDTGVVASSGKIRIANKYWNSHLSNFNQNSDLQFHYYKFGENYDRNNIINDENTLIEMINPIGNYQWKRDVNAISIKDSIQLFESF
jgi:hypothetical protein